MSPRGKHRLELAKGLLKLEGLDLAKVMEYINFLPEDRKATIKSYIDWIEDYENN